MTPEQFCYWLQGVLETRPSGSLDAHVAKVIHDHLAQVFNKKTPNYMEELQKVKPSIAPDTSVWPQTMPFTMPTLIC